MPDNHKKPTVEELAEQIKATQAEIDRQIAEDTPIPSPSEEIPPEPSPSEEHEGEPTSSEEIPSPSQEIPSPSHAPEEPDYKKKFSESSREAQVLLSKTKKYEQAAAVAEPSEDQLKLEFPEWEEMNATERRLAKDTLWNNLRFAELDKITKEGQEVDAWNDNVNKFITDPKILADNPELEGKQESFTTFATRPSRRGVDMNDLVLAFLGEAAKNRPAPKKGQMFEQGSAGPNVSAKPKDEKISLDEAALLMSSDYKKYKQYLLAGKIKNE